MTVNTAERKKKKKKEILVWWSKQVRYFICETQTFILALSSSEAIWKLREQTNGKKIQKAGRTAQTSGMGLIFLPRAWTLLPHLAGRHTPRAQQLKIQTRSHAAVLWLERASEAPGAGGGVSRCRALGPTLRVSNSPGPGSG